MAFVRCWQKERLCSNLSLSQLHGAPQREKPRRFDTAVLHTHVLRIVALLILVFWQSRSTVFLDKICIHQTDQALKAEGIMSIGGFLTNSKSLLVMWDATYVWRLWCIFEYAAFVKSHPDCPDTALKIRPTFLGPCTLAIAFGSLVVSCQHHLPCWVGFSLIKIARICMA
ncbi:cpr6 [Symbiodinium pilosum]|uniref:Cpr6 protein n=1 Tax=Symbiodinium pilosum TaxID=2952 RepID=A0A812TYL3_SYMPI|nr:cpr6 [Symbiodinium pilosum]